MNDETDLLLNHPENQEKDASPLLTNTSEQILECASGEDVGTCASDEDEGLKENSDFVNIVEELTDSTVTSSDINVLCVQSLQTETLSDSLENSAVSSTTKCPNKLDRVSNNIIESKSLETLEGELDFEEEIHEKDEASKEDLDDGDKVEDLKKDDKSEEKSSEEGEDDGELSDEKSSEEGEDDGELSDDDDLEEGEVKDTSSRSLPSRPLCRFYIKGQCTWGTSCRFIHPGINDKGNYCMFGPSRLPPLVPGNGVMGCGLPPGLGPPVPGPIGNQRPGPLPVRGPDFLPPLPLPPPPPPPPVLEPPPVESAWERGLRHAKELMKKAMRRKEQEPDFEEKRLNLSIDENERIALEYDKENEYFGRSPYRRPGEVYSYFGRYNDAGDNYDNGEREVREYWRGGRYENFEVRWTRHDAEHKENRKKMEQDRSRPYRATYDREKPERRVKEKERWRDERFSEVQAPRSRADEWRDPWRRSKTPKGRRSHSRGRSRGSYSSASSHSYSERSSRSSYSSHSSSSRSSYYSSHSRSYSRSRSRSRFRSRSRSPSSPLKPTSNNKLPQRKRYPPSPVASPGRTIHAHGSSLDRRKQISPIRNIGKGQPPKRKADVPRKSRSRSFSHSDSSHSQSHSRSSSSHSRSLSRSHSPSPSRSRSYSPSLSMSSVSSASSSISRTSSGSESGLDRAAGVSLSKKSDQTKRAAQKGASKPPPRDTLDRGREKELEKNKERDKDVGKEHSKEKLPEIQIITEHEKPPEDAMKPSLNVITLPTKSVKDPLKHSGHKQQIKLTLLNKTVPQKTSTKREGDGNKHRIYDRDDAAKNSGRSVQSSGAISAPTKRPGSPLPANVTKVAPPKRSTSSRREELLKQLKAVEDAIARKRAKFS